MSHDYRSRNVSIYRDSTDLGCETWAVSWSGHPAGSRARRKVQTSAGMQHGGERGGRRVVARAVGA